MRRATPENLGEAVCFKLWKDQTDPPIQKTEWRIMIPKKLVRLSTDRNRWRRRLKEILRQKADKISPGYQASLKLCSAEKRFKPVELEKEIIRLLQVSGLWQEGKHS